MANQRGEQSPSHRPVRRVMGSNDPQMTPREQLLSLGYLRCRSPAGTGELVRSVGEVGRSLFAAPEAFKAQYVSDVVGSRSGWRPALAGSDSDIVELWQLDRDSPKNAWPASRHDERLKVLRLCEEASSIVTDRLRDLFNCDVFPAEFRDLESLTSGISIRLLHYSPDDSPASFKAHRDLGLATVFMDESERALQVQRPDGSWELVAPRPSNWVVVPGKIVELMTSGRIPATTHRVVGSRTDRFAVVAFLRLLSGIDVSGTLNGQETTVNDLRRTVPRPADPITRRAVQDRARKLAGR